MINVVLRFYRQKILTAVHNCWKSLIRISFSRTLKVQIVCLCATSYSTSIIEIHYPSPINMTCRSKLPVLVENVVSLDFSALNGPKEYRLRSLMSYLFYIFSIYATSLTSDISGKWEFQETSPHLKRKKEITLLK